MPYTALVTGASAGLGAEFAKQLAALGVDLVLVARDAQRLGQLATTLGGTVRVEVLPADLVSDEGLDAVAARLSDAARPIDILINNAGFGIGHAFHESSMDDEQRMHVLLAYAPLRLTHAVLPGMLQRRRGWILNVASMAAFLPIGSYGSAKASVVMLSRSLNATYRSRGVHVTALCPGFVHTEFHARMGEQAGDAPEWMWADPTSVVRDGIRAVRRGQSVCVSDWRYRLMRPLTALMPDRLQAQFDRGFPADRT